MPDSSDYSSTIRALRARSNEAIASRNTARVVSFMAEDVEVRVAGGPMLRGRQASATAFSEQFADPAFRGYVRTSQHITVADGNSDAAAPADTASTTVRVIEHGEWVGRWRIPSGLHEQRGHYTAEWRLGDIGWQIASETFTSAL